MDRVIAGCNSIEIGHGLRLCDAIGVAFQADMNRSVDYGLEYFTKYERYQELPVFLGIQRTRFEQLCKATVNQKSRRRILDIGVGCGSFLEHVHRASNEEEPNLFAGAELFGWDVNPVAKSWLADRGWLFDPYSGDFPDGPVCWTMWDVVEHIRNPHELMDRIRFGDTLCVSLPVYDDLRREVQISKHYRPDEHYYYFTKWGFIKWLSEYGVKVIEYNENETSPECGREGIGTFIGVRLA